MPPIHEEVYTVLVCDDVEGEDDFAPRFAADARERARAGGARRRLEMDGPVMPDPDDLLGELRHRLQHGSALPSLILLDDGFSSPDGAGVDRDYLAFATLQRLKHVFAGRAPLPPVVLWSSGEQLNVLDHYAFCALGGAHVVEKGLQWPQRCAILWDAIDGRPWRPLVRPPNVSFDGKPWQREILPALEQGYGHQQTVQWLAQQERRPRTRAGGDSLKTVRHAVHDATHALGNNPQLLEHIRAIEPEWPGLADGGSRKTVALAAARAGELFIPIRHRMGT